MKQWEYRALVKSMWRRASWIEDACDTVQAVGHEPLSG